MQYTTFLGIDVSKLTLDCCFRCPTPTGVRQRYTQVANTASGYQRLLAWLPRQGGHPATTICCLEQTGVYDDQLLQALTTAGWVCALEKTTVLQKVAPEHHYKTDAVDAARLAEYAERFQDQLTPYVPLHPVQVELRALLIERNRLVAHRQATRQKQHQAVYQTTPMPTLDRLWDESVVCLSAQIATIEQRMLVCLKTHPRLYHRYQQVTAIPGVGPCFGSLWVSVFGDQPWLNPRQIASRYGHAPHARTSGSSRRIPPTSTGHGEALFRKLVTLVARSAQQHWHPMQIYKAKKLAEGKAPRLITNNVINRMIRIICAIWNADSWFDPDYQSPFVT